MKNVIFTFTLLLFFQSYNFSQIEVILPVHDTYASGWLPGMGIKGNLIETVQNPFIEASIQKNIKKSFGDVGTARYFYFSDLGYESINKTDFNVYAEAKFLFGGGNLTIGRKAESINNSRSICINTYVITIDSTQTLDRANEIMSKDASELIRKKKAKDFIENYGSYYFGSLEWGRSVSIQLTINDVSQSEFTELTGSLGINVKSGFTKINVNSTLTNLLSKKMKNKKVEVLVKVHAMNPGSIDSAFKTLIEDLVSKENDLTTIATTISSILTTKNLEPTVMKWVAYPYKNKVYPGIDKDFNLYDENRETSLNKLINRYFVVTKMINLRQSLIDNYYITLNPKIIIAAKNDINILNSYIESIAKIYPKCVDNMCVDDCCDIPELDANKLSLETTSETVYPKESLTLSTTVLPGDDMNYKFGGVPLNELTFVLERNVFHSERSSGFISDIIDFSTNDNSFQGFLDAYIRKLAASDQTRYGNSSNKSIIVQVTDLFGRRIKEFVIGKLSWYFDEGLQHLRFSKKEWYASPKEHIGMTELKIKP